MLNALTIDVEDYFQVTAFEKYVKYEDWDIYPSRVESNTLKILEMLDELSVKATFFILGWVAERCPSVVREIQKRGHEIASHGYKHKLLYHISPEDFRKDIRRAKMLLEDISGKKINGYRAPSYSITEESMWALDILIKEGFLYDSSIFPILHDIYGMPNARRFPHEISRPSGMIKEFPMSTFKFRISNFAPLPAGWQGLPFVGQEFRIPISGGGYMRLFPVWLIRRVINHINKREGQPAILYFHPWEIDHEQPKIRAGIRSRFRHYINLDRTAGKVKHLLSSFKFAPIGQVLKIP
ncbi:MAG: polysaccharide deacetylase [Candidatus Scalindua rubra]|uniref:Polysaccharide deacetylase n=1 Tax=Candidatus Scalindua rubra TaxID=1872076 RepID=A0A1E3X5L9_9BACT|nr:MAG: polysaccharide deacetylase [Candidatus Scalindua rubra]